MAGVTQDGVTLAGVTHMGSHRMGSHRVLTLCKVTLYFYDMNFHAKIHVTCAPKLPPLSSGNPVCCSNVVKISAVDVKSAKEKK